VRVLHTSDWHLGRSFHGVDILEHQRAFISWLIGLVDSEQIELVVVAGDVYDRAVPPLAAVALWEEAVIGITRRCPMLVTSGNHDSPTRLGFAGPLLAESGLHLRTSLDDIGRPLVIEGRDGVTVATYGIPYLEPDLHRQALGAERSHAAVLDAAMERIRADLAAREGARSIVAAHAFVTGGEPAVVSESERDLRVGGIGDAPASVFAGVDHVALGHLHGAQQVSAHPHSVAYSGSPLAFSFSEESHDKSVTVLDVPASGPIQARRIPTPVPRALVTLTGTLDDLLADPATTELAGHWVRVVLTDDRRPVDPMGRIRELLPHAVELTFERRALASVDAGDGQGAAERDPLAIAEAFIEHVTSTPPEATERALLRESVERIRIGQVPE
jgi:DNA repair protein SbcD/Mre11